MIPQFALQNLARLASGRTTSGYYLYIKEVSGTATGAYAGWMVITSYREAGLQGISITKAFDKASVQLMLHITTGKHLEEALLDIVAQGRRLCRITMKDVIVTSLSNAGNVETVTLHYAKMTYLPN